MNSSYYQIKTNSFFSCCKNAESYFCFSGMVFLQDKWNYISKTSILW